MADDLKRLIRTISLSGEIHISPESMKLLKELCRTSDQNIETCFSHIFVHLEKKHSQVRLTMLGVIEELFARSKLFRSLLVEKLQQFLLLTVHPLNEEDTELPPPRMYADLLHTKALTLMLEWNSKYGSLYKPISLAFHHLKQQYKVEL